MDSKYNLCNLRILPPQQIKTKDYKKAKPRCDGECLKKTKRVSQAHTQHGCYDVCNAVCYSI